MNNLVDDISELYFSKRDMLGEKKYHYMVRAMLFEGRKFNLEDFGSYFNIGNTKAYLQDVVLSTDNLIKTLQSDRRMYANKYQQIIVDEQHLIRGALGKYLFNISPNYTYISRKDIEEFCRDEEAIKSLSTNGVNTLILADKLLKIRRLPSIQDLASMGFRIDDTEVNKKVYFFTHLVLADSVFYTLQIDLSNKVIFKKLLLKIEELIIDNYEMVTMDAKLEYLLVVKMIDGKARIADKVLDEVRSSINPGGYIDDYRRDKHSLKDSEHRNMLYVGLEKWSGSSTR